MRLENICLCGVQTLFVRGGAELLLESLASELKDRDYIVDTISLPLFNAPRKNLLHGALSWRMMDLGAYTEHPTDLVIATKFPSYAIQHPNKITWLFHQLREAYDLFNTEYFYFHNTAEDQDIREMIVTIDNTALPESKAIYTISKNVSLRLKRFNGIDSTVLYPPPKRAFSFRSAPPENFILTVGRLEPIKRIELLVRAMAFTPDYLQAMIVGEGPHRPLLEQIIVKLGLEKKVHLLGNISDEELVDLYARCFGVYYAPFDEDYGFVTVEAFLSRKPVITCYDSGGPLEFVHHEDTGLICHAAPHEVGEAINRLYSNPQQSQTMGLQGYDLVKDITWDRVIEVLLSTL